MVIADLQLAHATNGWPPRQCADDFTAACKRVEGHAIRGRPAILRRCREHRTLESDIGVLERELPDTEFGEPFDVTPHHLFAVDVAASHHASGPDGQAANGVKELFETRGRRAHQSSIERFVKMMPRIAHVRQAGAHEVLSDSARQQAPVREAGDLFEELLASANDVENGIRAQQRLAAAGDDQPRSAPFTRESEVAFKIELPPVDSVLS